MYKVLEIEYFPGGVIDGEHYNAEFHLRTIKKGIATKELAEDIVKSHREKNQDLCFSYEFCHEDEHIFEIEEEPDDIFEHHEDDELPF